MFIKLKLRHRDLFKSVVARTEKNKQNFKILKGKKV